MRRIADDEQGVTLVELLVVLVVGAVIVAAVSQTVIGAMVAQRRQIARVEALNYATLALERLTRDLRGAELAGAVDASRIDFTTWRRGAERPVTVALEPDGAGGHRLVVRDPAPRVLLQSLADDAVFGFEDQAGIPLAEPIAADEVAAVTVAVTVSLPENRGPVVLTDHIVLRNAELR